MTFKRKASNTAGAAYALISLIRPINAAMTFFGVVVGGMLAAVEWSAATRILIAAGAGFLLASAGNTVNDIFDIEIDRINKPYRALASGKVSVRTAIVWGTVCASGGLILGALAGAQSFVFALASFTLAFVYNSRMKRVPLAGNAIVAFLTGCPLLYGSLVAGKPEAGIIAAAFAFLMNFAREILKDIEDLEGDKACGVFTFPARHGIKAALMIASVLLMVTAGSSLLPFFFGIYGELYFWMVLIGIDSVLILLTFVLWRTPAASTISRICVVLKYDMALGLFALLLGSR